MTYIILGAIAVILVGVGAWYLYNLTQNSPSIIDGGYDEKMQNALAPFHERVAEKNNISADEVRFIDESFKKHGGEQGAAFGDLTGGLEPLVQGNTLTIKKTEGRFIVEVVGDTWDLSIVIDAKTGEWISATQGDLAPEPEQGER